MSSNGTIVLYPAKAPKAVTAVAQEAIAAEVIKAMVVVKLLPGAVLKRLTFDREISPLIAEHFEARTAKVGALTHATVDPELLDPRIGNVVYADNAKSFWGEKKKAKRDLVAVPFVDVSVLAKPLAVHDADGAQVVKTNVLLEFSYGDARYSPTVHKVRDPEHPLFESLKEALGSKIEWCVVRS